MFRNTQSTFPTLGHFHSASIKTITAKQRTEKSWSENNLTSNKTWIAKALICPTCIIAGLLRIRKPLLKKN